MRGLSSKRFTHQLKIDKVLALLQAVRGQVPPTWTVIVLADRGLYAKWLFEGIQGLGWHPLLRVNAGGTFRPAGWVHRYPLTHWTPTVGRRWQGRGTAFAGKKTRLDCTLLADWGEGHQDPWLILTDLPPNAADACWYGLRAWIEIYQPYNLHKILSAINQ
jgi:hypothetical protein